MPDSLKYLTSIDDFKMNKTMEPRKRSHENCSTYFMNVSFYAGWDVVCQLNFAGIKYSNLFGSTFGEILGGVKTSQLICFTDRLTGFYMTRDFADR